MLDPSPPEKSAWLPRRNLTSDALLAARVCLAMSSSAESFIPSSCAFQTCGCEGQQVRQAWPRQETCRAPQADSVRCHAGIAHKMIKGSTSASPNNAAGACLKPTSARAATLAAATNSTTAAPQEPRGISGLLPTKKVDSVHQSCDHWSILQHRLGDPNGTGYTFDSSQQDHDTRPYSQTPGFAVLCHRCTLLEDVISQKFRILCAAKCGTTLARSNPH